MSVLSHDMVR